MTTAEQYQEAMTIEADAWKLIKAFDDTAEETGVDRQVQYAAFIIMMTSFCRSSTVPVADILTDFCQRVGAGTHARKEQQQ